MTSPAEGGSARVACRVPELLGAGGATGEATGALWKLAESGRQLDANVVRLAPGTRVAPHVEPDLDVLLVVVAGDGMLDGGEVPRELTEGAVVWLPHGSTRGITAGGDGLAYLTVHRRRPGMQIRRRTG
ncbi:MULTISPECIES: cupin domain-containing protein [unclassified Streptomyces]|uniref:Cupin domain-containing protein n=1 Tax=Streptomyces thermocoprophilus TaxID=78356 RepID=A0ABV5VLF2_9ACTN